MSRPLRRGQHHRGLKAMGGALRPFAMHRVLALIFVVLQRAEFVVIRLLRRLLDGENSLIRGIGMTT